MNMFEEGYMLIGCNYTIHEGNIAVIEMAIGLGYKPSKPLEYLLDEQVEASDEEAYARAYLDKQAQKEGFGVDWVDCDLVCYALGEDETE